MPVTDLNQGYDSSKSKIGAIKTYIEVSKSAKKLKSSAGNSLSQSIPDVASQLNKVSEQQKRYLKNQPTSFDEIFDLIKLANGSGLETLDYLKKKLLETVVKIEPSIKKIISEEAIKALGCSQEQTFQGFTSTDLEFNPLETLPVGQGIYVPVQSMDLSTLLKVSPTSKIGKVLYEKQTPNANSGNFLPYGGIRPYPMNKEFYQRLTGTTKSYKGEYGKYYQGVSGQDLFDFQYSPTNQFGVDQASYRVVLISKVNSESTQTGGTVNKVIDFLEDYYGTIKLFDTVDFTATLMNVVSGAINMKTNLGSDEITEQSKFFIFLQRILGLCFDSRREIDVSGISKIAELDGVDETFFESTEVDLRNIDARISNIQNGVMELIDCDNIKVPVDFETIVDNLINLRERDDLSNEEQVQGVIDITNSLIQNPDWNIFLPTNFQGPSLNEDFIKQIPLAVAGSILSPKVLFPIFTLLQVLETNATNAYNNAVTSANTYIQSANTINGSVNNIINNPTDFIKTFKTFNIQVTSRIGSIFIEQLFQLLKKDIINLLKPVISDIAKGRLEKRYLTVNRLVNIALILQQLVKGVDDYRKCKSLVDDIITILNLLSGLAPPNSTVSNALLLLTKFLPGTSPERASINIIQEMQKFGLPTGPLPDGSSNLMQLLNFAIQQGAEQEQAENGKVEVSVITPVGVYPGYGKAG